MDYKAVVNNIRNLVRARPDQEAVQKTRLAQPPVQLHSNPEPSTFPRQHGTLIVSRSPSPIDMAQLFAATRRLYPDIVLGDWTGNIYDETTARSGNIELLRFGDAKRAAVLNFNGPPPPISLDLGPFPNLLWPSAAAELKTGGAHIRVQAIDPVSSAAEAVVRARVLTLLTSVVASMVPTIGVISVDGSNALTPSLYASIAKEAYRDPLQGVPVWVRVTCGKVPVPGLEPATHAYTMGLVAFGVPEFEYVDLKPGLQSIMQHAYWLAQYLIETGVKLKSGEKIGAPAGFPMARVEFVKGNGNTRPDVYRIRWDR